MSTNNLTLGDNTKLCSNREEKRPAYAISFFLTTVLVFMVHCTSYFIVLLRHFTIIGLDAEFLEMYISSVSEHNLKDGSNQ